MAAIVGGYFIHNEIRALERDNITLWLSLPIGRLCHGWENAMAQATLIAGVVMSAPLAGLGVPV